MSSAITTSIIDTSKNRRYAGHLDVTYEPAASWLRTIKAGVKAERSRRTLIEGNVMELSGPLTLAQFGTGRLVNTGVVGAPYPAYLSLNIANLKNWRNYAQNLINGNSSFVNEYIEDDGKIAQMRTAIRATKTSMPAMSWPRRSGAKSRSSAVPASITPASPPTITS
jgi:hypothetical protein